VGIAEIWHGSTSHSVRQGRGGLTEEQAPPATEMIRIWAAPYH